MVSITLSIPNDLKKKMEEYRYINWSAVAREAIKKKIIMLERFQQFTKDSKFTEGDALNLGADASRKALKKHSTEK